MPLSAHEMISAGEASSSDLEIPSQTLSIGHVDAFLDFVFSEVARKPETLSLREGASTVRYLQALCRQLPMKEDRLRLQRQLKQLWRTLLDAPWKPASKGSAIRFLDRHADTFLAGTDVAWLRSVIEQAAPIEPRKEKPPRLMNKTMSISGAGSQHLLDDLSERIHGAYYTLRQSKMQDARGRIARALNGKQLYSRARTRSKLPWGGDEVIERVKEYEKMRRRQMSETTAKKWKDNLPRLRRQAANKWIFLFVTSEGGSPGQDGHE